MLLHEDITKSILDACGTVHNTLGCGFLERVYQEALEVTLQEMGIPYQREKHLPIVYHGHQLQCDYIADFIIENKVIVEVKAVSEMNTGFEAQVINYLKATGIKVGLLVNFGNTRLQVKRLVY